MYDLSFHIYGGVEAKPGEFPYAVALGYVNKDLSENPASITYECGGSLISIEHVLTAAHCVNNINEKVPVEVSIFVWFFWKIIKTCTSLSIFVLLVRLCYCLLIYDVVWFKIYISCICLFFLNIISFTTLTFHVVALLWNKLMRVHQNEKLKSTAFFPFMIRERFDDIWLKNILSCTYITIDYVYFVSRTAKFNVIRAMFLYMLCNK